MFSGLGRRETGSDSIKKKYFFYAEDLFELRRRKNLKNSGFNFVYFFQKREGFVLVIR